MYLLVSYDSGFPVKFAKFILEFFNYDDLSTIQTYFQIIFHFSRSFFQGDIHNLNIYHTFNFH